MVVRYAPPISYNFLNLIRLGGNAKTIFEKVTSLIIYALLFFFPCFSLIMILFKNVSLLFVYESKSNGHDTQSGVASFIIPNLSKKIPWNICINA